MEAETVMASTYEPLSGAVFQVGAPNEQDRASRVSPESQPQKVSTTGDR
jgi:hypothetical protein